MAAEILRVGVDFDNTIVCYDNVFVELAFEKGLVAKQEMSKQLLRDHLRQTGREDAWTELQGEVYGSALHRAAAFPGAAEFLKLCVRDGIAVSIISHKTRHPFRGPKYDLHLAAREWLVNNGFFDPQGVGLKKDEVYLELTKEDKIKRIAELRCTYFIDDLPEFLLETGFPKKTERILFDPARLHDEPLPFRRARSWAEISKWILNKTSSI